MRGNLRARRLAVAGLGLAGTLDSLYMLAYHGGLLDRMACPFFGKGCQVVARSQHARHLGVPNAAVGTVAYSGMAALALWAGDRLPEERPVPALLLAGLAGAAGVAGAFLTWEQKARVRAWCFWCLTSAGITGAILALSLGDGLRALRGGAAPGRGASPREETREAAGRPGMPGANPVAAPGRIRPRPSE